MNIETTLFEDQFIHFGGPVQTEFFWVMHSTDFSCKSTIPINKDLSISAAIDVLPLLGKEKLPVIYQIGVGYSGWGPKQLDQEIEEGSWWYTHIAQEKLLSVEDEIKWDIAIESLGVDPSSLFDTNPLNSFVN